MLCFCDSSSIFLSRYRTSYDEFYHAHKVASYLGFRNFVAQIRLIGLHLLGRNFT